MKKLIIDIGNTCSKLALFEQKELIELICIKDISVEHLISFIKGYDIKAVIASSVINNIENIEIYLQNNYYYIGFNENVSIPIINKYKTPNSLGKDRLASVVGAYSLFPEDNVLVIDVGTCIKYDYKNNKNEYLGGAISPGIGIRLKSLNKYTNKLPLCEPRQISKLIGISTEESILSGVINGCIAEVDGIINRYKEQYDSLKIILSGGDAIYFDNRLKNSIFAVPNIVILGLNEILDYNVK